MSRLADAREPAAPGQTVDTQGVAMADLVGMNPAPALYIGQHGGFLEHFSRDAGLVA